MLWGDATGGPCVTQARAKGIALTLSTGAPGMDTIHRALDLAGLDQVAASDEPDCLRMINACKPDLVIADAGADPAQTAAFAQRIQSARLTQALPMLFVGSKGQTPADLVQISPDSTVSEAFIDLRALLRRERPTVLRDTRISKGFALDEQRFKITYGDSAHDLSKSELCLIGPFFDAPNAIFDRPTLERLAFNTATHATGNRQIEFYINKLRRVLKRDLGVDPLQLVRGAGYQLDASGAHGAAAP